MKRLRGSNLPWSATSTAGPAAGRGVRDRRFGIDHGAIGFFHGLIPALALALLLWCLLLLA